MEIPIHASHSACYVCNLPVVWHTHNTIKVEMVINDVFRDGSLFMGREERGFLFSRLPKISAPLENVESYFCPKCVEKCVSRAFKKFFVPKIKSPTSATCQK